MDARHAMILYSGARAVFAGLRTPFTIVFVSEVWGFNIEIYL
jgi:hypothetical protein